MHKEIIAIPLEDILDSEDFNCRGRINPLDVVSLAEDIKAKGLIQPVVVAPIEGPFKYRLIAGYRRFMAHKVINAKTIDAIVRKDLTDPEKAYFFNLSENLNRQDLTPLQEAKAVGRLRDFGIRRDRIAKELGKSGSWVQHRYYLLELPVEIQTEIDCGVIPIGNIVELWMINDSRGSEKCLEAARRIKEAREKGLKNISVNPNKLNREAKKPRKRNEIFLMLDHFLTAFDEGGFWSKCMAWCAGEITTNDLFDCAEEFAKIQGHIYSRPPETDDPIPDLLQEVEANKRFSNGE